MKGSSQPAGRGVGVWSRGLPRGGVLSDHRVTSPNAANTRECKPKWQLNEFATKSAAANVPPPICVLPQRTSASGLHSGVPTFDAVLPRHGRHPAIDARLQCCHPTTSITNRILFRPPPRLARRRPPACQRTRQSRVNGSTAGMAHDAQCLAVPEGGRGGAGPKPRLAPYTPLSSARYY